MSNIRLFPLYAVTVLIGLVNPDVLAGTVKGTVKDGFPKLGHYAIGAPHAWGKTDSEGVTYRTALARLDMAIINFLPRASNQAQADGIRDLKARNPDMFLFDYNMFMQQKFNNAGGAGDYADELDTNRWWVYRSGDGGTILRTDNTEFGFANVTNFARVNADGDRWNTFYAKEIKRRTHALVPEFDGTFTDNFGVLPNPPESAGGTENKGDWNRDGTADDRGSTLAQNAWRDGYATFIGALRTNIPGDIHAGNIGPWKEKTPSEIPQYNNLLEGGILEQYLSNTPAEPAFVNALAGYHKIMGMLNNPKLLVVIGKTKTLGIEYDAMRYGLAFTLMDNGYFMFSKGNTSQLHNDAGYGEAPPWFDEYDPEGVPGGTSWLGEPIDPPQTAPWQNGIYMRRFEFGAALVNPKGNGTRTVTLPTGERYKRIDGRQVPSINNGQDVTSVTLNDRDGLLLIKVGGVPRDTTEPTAPTNLAATAPSATSVDLTWTASTDNVGVTGYRVQRCSGSSTCTNFTQISTTTGTVFSDTELAASTIYRYRVLAEDAAGNLSSYSAIASTTTPPTAPTGLTATVVSLAQIDLSWTDSTDAWGVAEYQMQRCAGAGCTTFSAIGTSTATAFSNTGLTVGTTYRYRVRAADAAGNLSAFSSNVTASTPLDTTAPTAPSNLAGTALSTSSIDLSWTASTDDVGVTGYHLERCAGAACANFAPIASPANATYNDTGLAENTPYQYRVRAVDAAGNPSAYSGTVSVTTLAATDTTPPSVPTKLRATAPSPTHVNLLWDASTDNVGVTSYRLQRCLGTDCTNFSLLRTITTGTSYADKSVSGGQVYRYRVRAVDAAVNLSGFSTITFITTP
jgi:fibronectin type 3 domain-containing protein